MHDIQYLSISGIYTSDKTILLELTRLAAHHQCQVLHCYTNRHGDKSVVLMLISGSWSALGKFESSLHLLEKEEGLQLSYHRSSVTKPKTPYLPYVLYVIAREDVQALHRLLLFLQQEDVIVQEVFTESYQARYTSTPMQAFTVRIQLDANLAISEWRERFMLFSDDLNLDAVMEPEKW